VRRLDSFFFRTCVTVCFLVFSDKLNVCVGADTHLWNAQKRSGLL
jgi:hypothetical protein